MQTMLGNKHTIQMNYSITLEILYIDITVI